MSEFPDAVVSEKLQLSGCKHQSGHLAEADAIYLALFSKLETAPDCLSDLSVNHAFLSGIHSRMHQRWGHASKAFNEVIRKEPRHPTARLHLAKVLAKLGQVERAGELVMQAVELNPESAINHHDLARVFHRRRDFKQADTAYRRALEINPKSLMFQANLGHLLSQTSQAEAAQACYVQVIHATPDCCCDFHVRACVFDALNALDQGLADHRQAVELSSKDISLHAAVIRAHQRRGNFNEAQDACRSALQSVPDSNQIWELLGQTLQAVGQFQEAAKCFERSMQIRPSGSVALLLARMSRQTKIACVDLITHPDATPREKIAAGFAMAEIFDRADQFDEAFDAYTKANAQFKSFSAQHGQQFDAEKLTQNVDQMISTYTPRYFQASLDFAQQSESPVFIVGMPRSGTTLVEQILAAHSQVHAAGELPDIALIQDRLALMDIHHTPQHWQRHWHRHLGKLHLAKLEIKYRNARRIVDKMPANLFHLGLIATMFPLARVILCQRNPIDTCLSCFFQLFENHNLMFSYDLADCGIQYFQQQRLVSHWQQVLPLRVLQVKYETLVSDFEPQSRRLIDFAGLDWEPACLELQNTTRPVLTRSAWQVRQPIYSRSVNRWKHYEKHLASLWLALSGHASL